MGLKRIAILLFFLINSSFFSLQAEVLKTINVSMPTPYGLFLGEIHYSEKDLILALKVERIIKEDLIKVINYFEYVPQDVVHFNIDPYLRLTNGNATPFPTNIINLYNFPANNNEHLIVMENWLQGLVLHEFVHITHLDQTRDYLSVGRHIFGTIAKLPTSIVPRWFTEGIAVWGESHLINGGRLNNPLFNKELLLQFKKNDFCKNIDCLDNPGNYPQGQLSYWAGAHFIEFIENLKPKSIKCLVEYNSKSIPFFLNNAFEACTGDLAQHLFQTFRQNFLANVPSESPLASYWGEKISNSFGSDDFQKGVVLDGDRLFKVEHQKKSEALVAYDLLDQINFKNQFDAPISDLSGMVDPETENKMLLVSFNEDPRFRTQNKVWKLIDPDTLLVERTLSFPHDPSYVIPLGNEQYVTFSYWKNSWQVEKGNVLVGRFPSNYNIVLVKKLGEKLLLKINDANGVSSLILCDLNLQALSEIYKSEKTYDLPLITPTFLVIRENGELKLLEFEKGIQLSSLPKNLFNNTTFVDISNKRILALEDGLKTKEVDTTLLFDLIKKEKLDPKEIVATEYKILTPLSPSEGKSESYPRLNHLLPHWWFLAAGNSDNLNSIGAMTSFVDPMEIYSLGATALLYPTEKKAGGSLLYNQNMIKYSDLWSISANAGLEYSKTSFNPRINQTSELGLASIYKVLRKRWVYVPGVFASSSMTDDFISKRTITKVGSSSSLVYQALMFDDFFQYLVLAGNLGADKSSLGKSYLATHLQSEAAFRLNQKLVGSLKGTYAKLFKSDFSREVVYGGGISNFAKIRLHPFYGLPYSNAYGNEIATARLLFDYNFWDIYRGKNLFPLFLKEAHFLLGHDSLYANRIFLDKTVLKDETIHSIFAGPSLKLNIFYNIPADADLIFSTINSPTGKNINQVEFVFSVGLF